MLKPKTALAAVIEQFQADAPVRESTMAGYRCSLRLFVEWLAAKGISKATLADLTDENAVAFAANFRQKDKRAPRYNEHHKVAALRGFSKWLAEQRLFYDQRGDQRLSVLRDVRLPKLPTQGRRVFTDQEARDILSATRNLTRNAIRERAIMTLQLSAPLRPDEVRRIRVRDFQRSGAEVGHVLIRESKTEAGTNRTVPLGKQAEAAILAYLRFERHSWTGAAPPEFKGEEPLFLTDEGSGFTYWGWVRRGQLLAQKLRAAGIPEFVQYRARGYAAKRLQRTARRRR
jgi:site-specific recombinase XerD